MTTARRVFAVPLCSLTGRFEEDGWTAVTGRATTAEEAADRVSAEGWIVAVQNPTTAPGVLVGQDEDVWAVPAYATTAAQRLAEAIVEKDFDAAPDGRVCLAAALLREANGGAIGCDWSAADIADQFGAPLGLARAACAAYSRAAARAAHAAMPWVIADGRGAKADDLGGENVFDGEEEAEEALASLRKTLPDWDLSGYSVRRATAWEVR